LSEVAKRISEFVAYAEKLDGDEKGEAQVFCDRLFRGFGHAGYKEAGATLEFRIKKKSSKGTSFADLMWKPKLLLEMKKRGEKLHLHYNQAFEYWLNAVPNRPRYVILCNFDEFWIYDFDKQLDEPVDRVSLVEIPKRYTALNFLFPGDKEPIFNNDREAVSKKAAGQTAELFQKLIRRPGAAVPRDQAQRFVLQLVIAMFGEDIDLLPAGMVTGIVRDCLEHHQSSFDLLGGLFRQMDSSTPVKSGRYAGVPYYNGGLFSHVDPIELTKFELDLIGGEDGAATRDWTKINPAIFGTLFQYSMGADVQHQYGRHFTSEADIQRVIVPTIVRPMRQLIDAATTMGELLELRKELAKLRVLDPACGSGNFLYVAFREMARLDIRIMSRLRDLVSIKEFAKQAKSVAVVSPKQFFGIDNDAFAVELAKVTLMLAKKLAHDEAVSAFQEDGEYEKGNFELNLAGDDSLPLDNLDSNFVLGDALFEKWPEAEVIIGNPPFQSKNKIQGELDRTYLTELRERYPEVDGRSDYCVYWFRLAHDHLKPGQRAGLVGTNTVRQNYSREAGLDYITQTGGVITEAVSTMVWPGEAVVHVSIVNWIKGEADGQKRLYAQDGNLVDSGWRYVDLERIPASLSFSLDVTQAKSISANSVGGGCFQGQTHGHKGFLLERSAAQLIIADDARYGAVLKPFLIADDLVGEINSKASRYVIDFSGMDQFEAETYPKVFQRVKEYVLPDRKTAALNEEEENKKVLEKNPKAKVNRHHANFLKSWWQLSYARGELMNLLNTMPRYLVCGRVTKRPIFDFVSSQVHPNDALQVFAMDDDYSFGLLQSGIHWAWFTERCSTLKSDPRYTSNTVFDSFPWPQSPTASQIRKVADAGIALRSKREEFRQKYNLNLRELYRKLEEPGDHPMKTLQSGLDAAVWAAYGVGKKADALSFLLALNADVVAAEAQAGSVRGPGLPDIIKNRAEFVTADCITA
jgi:SAM-dependent methyltransferase